ncbi:hypothetical protein [Neobacillus sp. FSL H8-0543]|uniref:HAAS domain-containing protein n=1 Tax=Neobacillus sp. FSL H8-0543 TaxID=2954672 RepID=UPI0031592150
MERRELSVQSKDFLENLRMYLFSSGKKEKEIDEVVEELSDHLEEAEQAGKNVEHIIGQSPEHYMKHLSEEMSTDYKGWTKFVPIFIIGVMAYFLLEDALQGTIHYSLLDLIGFPIVCLILLKVYMMTFKYLSKRKTSILKEFAVFYGVGLLSISLFIGLLLVKKNFGTPFIIVDSMLGRMIIGSLAVCIFVGMALWSKTWFSIFIPLIIFVPQFVTQFLQVSDKTEILLNSFLIFVGIIIFGIFELIKLKKLKAKSIY